MIVFERAEESECETLVCSDSDRESDYLTGAEDVLDAVTEARRQRLRKRILPCLNEISQTSSFIQDILSEDSLAGVEVVDLFVAVKNAKDELECLERRNNEILGKLCDLNREAVVFKHKYGTFVGSMKSFLAKMNADSQLWNVLVPRIKPNATDLTFGRSLPTAGKRSKHRRRGPEESGTKRKRNKWARCPNCDRKEYKNCERLESPHAGSGSDIATFLSCLMSSLKRNSVRRLPALSEAFLGSFVASLCWLQKRQEDSLNTSRSSSQAESVLEEKKETEFLHLGDSAIQIICDVCGSINEASCASSRQLSLKAAEETDDDPESSGAFDASDFWPDAGEGENAKSSDVSCSGENPLSTSLKKSKSENVSRFVAGDRIGERRKSDSGEASPVPLTVSTHYDLKAKPSVTCMGDLSGAVVLKNSGSVLAPTLSVMPSWIEKLSTEIISKLQNIKSKKSIKIFEQPFEKSDLSVKTLAGFLEFTVEANTPVGVLDFNVVRYNRSSSLDDRMLKFNAAPIQTPLDSNPTPDFQVSSSATNIKEDSCYSWSEESLRNVESDGVSHSGESDLEEFIQIFLESPKKNNKKGKINPLQEGAGILKKVEIKIAKCHFFEIQKCYQGHFVQNLLKKTQKRKGAVWPESRTEMSEEQILSLGTGEKRESQLVIQGSSTDLVIYIQVEVEDGGSSKKIDDGVVVEYQTSSLGTQTAEHASNEKPIRLKPGNERGFSLYNIWRAEERSSAEGGNPKRLMALGETRLEEDELENELIDEEERVVMVKELKEKSVTFNDELSEIFIEKELQETIPEDGVKDAELTTTASEIAVKNENQCLNIWLEQSNFTPAEKGEVRTPQLSAEDADEPVDASPMELEKALKLIREIESDVVDVKLDDAIAILPRLEMELRKHLQGKLKNLGGREPEGRDSLHNFFSTVHFWPEEEEEAENSSESSEDRLNSLLMMLSDLEDAVKSIDVSGSAIELSQSSKIYRLLHALTVSIRELEEGPSVVSLCHTMDIASQLDTVVREYDSIVRRQPLEYIGVQKEEKKMRKMDSRNLEDVPAQQYLKNVRKKVFEILQEEAIDVEERIDRDFDRMDRLERENDEALMFLEAFLQKSERRLLELSDLKSELKELSQNMNEVYECAKERMKRKTERENETETEREKETETENEMRVLHLMDVEERSTLTNSSVASVSGFNPPTDSLRQTVSGLLTALDTLKSRAKEKKNFCRELLSSVAVEKSQDPDISSQRSSRSSFTTKHPEMLSSSIREFKKIGDTSLYLSWTKPEGSLKGSLLGYQIHVNGKLNQKVRNPRRLQAILYSVDLTSKAEVQLYAITENSPKILLATASHQEE